MKSEQGAEVTTIDGRSPSDPDRGSVVIFENGEGPDTVIKGFTLTNGSGTFGYSGNHRMGGAVFCYKANPTVTGNIFSGNKAWDGNTIGLGGGIACWRQSVQYPESETMIFNNIMVDNLSAWGGAIYTSDQTVRVFNNTLINNSSTYLGGAICCDGLSTLYVFNSIFWNDDSPGGKELFVGGASGSDLFISYCDIEGGIDSVKVGSGNLHWGDGMINSNPLFIDAPNRDFHLQQDPCQPGVTNPCVDAGDPISTLIEGTTRTDGIPDTGIVDMGYHYAFHRILKVPSDYPTIQEAINAAYSGDTVFVSSDLPNGGFFKENIDFLGKAIIVKSKHGPRRTIIDGNQSGSVVNFINGEGVTSILEGFTITNGAANNGGGINCSSSSPTIKNNIITVNSAKYGGGFSCSLKSTPAIINTIITSNSAEKSGGGIYCIDSSSVITNSTIYGNTATDKGGGLWCYDSDLAVTNCIFWNNSAGDGNEIYVVFGGSINVTYCDVKGGYTGEGNIDSNPLFVDATKGDFHLRPSSPCCDAGSNDAAGIHETDYEGDNRIVDGNWPQDGEARVDMGADELFCEIAARFGKVNAKGTGLDNVLLMNSTPGDNRRVFSTTKGTSMTLSIGIPSQGPNPSPFALYVIEREAALADMARQPYGIGISCMPLPLTHGINPPPFCIANNIGYFSLLGYPIMSWVKPAPCTIISIPYGFPQGTYTLQGYIIDNGAKSLTGVSLTNAIVVRVQ